MDVRKGLPRLTEPLVAMLADVNLPLLDERDDLLRKVSQHGPALAVGDEEAFHAQSALEDLVEVLRG